jgi:hypothetical protein
MKRILFFLLLTSQCVFAQKGTSKRSNGDLLNGTWKCVKCKDTTIQNIIFQDTVYSYTTLSPGGLKTTKCTYRIKGHKIFINCDGQKKWKYKIVLIDYNTLELKQWKRGYEEFKKTR